MSPSRPRSRRDAIDGAGFAPAVHLLIAILILGLSGPASAQKKTSISEPLRGYTIMAGGLGRAPKDSKDMWSNTEKAHLAFIEEARINLVVVEVPYGVSKEQPRSASVASFIEKLKKRNVEVWIIYPHVLAQTFDLPRQVDADGQKVEWNCCFNRREVQDWLVTNGKSIVAAYEPDGLLLFGLFHTGSGCHCESCRKDKDARSGKVMEDFFLRFEKELHEQAPELLLGTTSFWSEPSKKALAAVDVVAPVIGIFRPGYAEAGRVTKELSGLRGRYKGKKIIPYVKLFLASQTDSKTEDVVAAARESLKQGDGFFFWGLNPGHSYEKQDYDHAAILKALRELAGKGSK